MKLHTLSIPVTMASNNVNLIQRQFLKWIMSSWWKKYTDRTEKGVVKGCLWGTTSFNGTAALQGYSQMNLGNLFNSDVFWLKNTLYLDISYKKGIIFMYFIRIITSVPIKMPNHVYERWNIYIKKGNFLSFQVYLHINYDLVAMVAMVPWQPPLNIIMGMKLWS